MTEQEWNTITVGAVIRNVFSGHNLDVLKRNVMVMPFRITLLVRRSGHPEAEPFTALWHDSYDVVSNGPLLSAEFDMPANPERVSPMVHNGNHTLAVAETDGRISIALIGTSTERLLPSMLGRRVRITVELIE